ncbi:Rrf2 family transcriptional regulator [Paenibacillaceae bacterium]|nr:Rrf2 family transcriptional regulator [Paenibacillaceae bacterium]
MGANSHFTIALHILSRIRYEHSTSYITSQTIARSVNTHAVFIRRILGALHKAELVDVRRGSVQSGWKLARAAGEITLLDVYDAVQAEPLQGMHHSEPNLNCPIGRGIQPALQAYYDAAEAAFRNELAKTSLEMVFQDTMSFAAE